MLVRGEAFHLRRWDDWHHAHLDNSLAWQHVDL